MSLPTAKDLARAWGQLTAAYKRWYLLRTARDTQAIRKNEALVKLQARAAILRRREVIARIERIRFQANTQAPTIRIRVPGVND